MNTALLITLIGCTAFIGALAGVLLTRSSGRKGKGIDSSVDPIDRIQGKHLKVHRMDEDI